MKRNFLADQTILLPAAYLYDFLDEPGFCLQFLFLDVFFDGLEEDAEVRLRRLDTGEQIRDDALEQRHVLKESRERHISYCVNRSQQRDTVMLIK